MRGKLRQNHSRKKFIIENGWILIALAIALALQQMIYRRGLPHKWVTAVFGTVVPFGVVMVSLRRRWSHLSFWTAYFLCFAVHLALILMFFQFALSSIRTLGLVLWFPVLFVETFVLIFAVAVIDRKITGGNEVIKIS